MLSEAGRNLLALNAATAYRRLVVEGDGEYDGIRGFFRWLEPGRKGHGVQAFGRSHRAEGAAHERAGFSPPRARRPGCGP